MNRRNFLATAGAMSAVAIANPAIAFNFDTLKGKPLMLLEIPRSQFSYWNQRYKIGGHSRFHSMYTHRDTVMLFMHKTVYANPDRPQSGLPAGVSYSATKIVDLENGNVIKQRQV